MKNTKYKYSIVAPRLEWRRGFIVESVAAQLIADSLNGEWVVITDPISAEEAESLLSEWKEEGK